MSDSNDSAESAVRPFQILGIQQVAIGGDRLDVLASLWVDTLGIPKTGEYESASENVREDILTLGSGPYAVEIDLMEPIDPDGRPRVNTPPLNHIGLWVDNLAVAYSWLEGRGIRFTPGGIRAGAGGHQVCFIHPKANNDFPLAGAGVLIELVQAPTEVITALS